MQPTPTIRSRRLFRPQGSLIEEERNQRLDIFAQLFRRVASILARDNVTVSFGSTRFGTAQTDGENIVLDESVAVRRLDAALKVRNLIDLSDYLADAEGLVYHELAHILYTPRVTHTPSRQIAESYVGYATLTYNILEDARIERRFIGRFPTSKPYFVRAITNFVAKGEATTSHVLLHGRRYLPAELRRASRQAFVDKFGDVDGIDVDRIDEIIDEYVTLTFPTDAKRAIALVTELAHVISLIWNSTDITNDNGESIFRPFDEHGQQEEGKPVKTKEQRRDESSAEDLFDDESTDEGDESTDDEADVTGTDADVEGDADPLGNGFGGDPNVPGDDGDDEGGEPTDGDPTGDPAGDPTGDGTTAGSGDGQSRLDPTRPLDELLEEAARSVESELNHRARRFLKSAQDLYEEASAIENQVVDEGGWANWTMRIEPRFRRHRDELIEALEELRGAAAPSWARRVERGRLNVVAAMEAEHIPNLDVFNKWTTLGDDAGTAEVVILVDQSTSMVSNGLVTPTSQGLWMIISACEELEIPVTVIGFASSTVLLHAPGHDVRTTPIATGGGTDPEDAVAGARRILGRSDARHKLLFSLTDGEWWGAEKAHATIQAMHGEVEGLQTLLLYLTGGRYSDKATLRGIRDRLLDEHDHYHESVFVGSPLDAVEHIAESIASAIASDILV